jgi:glycosyltransferase involved in cell wall biosynthesis
MQVSVITTLLNEAGSVHQFLDSLLAQTRPPDEVVLCDGGSTDGTVDIIQEYIVRGYPIRFITAAGANVPKGRNIAIATASYDLIAVTDAGCILDERWLEHIIQPLEADPEVMVVGGSFGIIGVTLFEKCTGAFTGYPADGTQVGEWLPSSRSIAFRKEAWQQVERYPEDLNWGEDTVFDLRLKAAGCKFAFARDAMVWWRPRPTLGAFFQQYYEYARGDGRALMSVLRYSSRFLLYAIGGTLLGLGIRFPLAWGFLVTGLLFYLLRRVWRAWQRFPRWATLMYTPILLVSNDLAIMFGYFRGLLDRLLRHVPRAT